MNGITNLVMAFVLAFAAVACGPNNTENSTSQDAETALTHLIIQFHVSADKIDDFLPIMTNINEGMASEEGFVEAVVYRDADDPLHFTLVEKWDSRALHEAHYDRIVSSGDWDNILSMLTNTPTLIYNEKL